MIKFELLPVLEKIDKVLTRPTSGVRDGDTFYLDGRRLAEYMEAVKVELPPLILAAMKPHYTHKTDEDSAAIEVECAKLTPLWSGEAHTIEGLEQAVCETRLLLAGLKAERLAAHRAELEATHVHLESGEVEEIGRVYENISIIALDCLIEWDRLHPTAGLPAKGTQKWADILAGWDISETEADVAPEAGEAEAE